MIWHQADAAGLSDPLERANFVLRRLYPEMSEAWFVDILGKLAARFERGEWHGFQPAAWDGADSEGAI